LLFYVKFIVVFTFQLDKILLVKKKLVFLSVVDE